MSPGGHKCTSVGSSSPRMPISSFPNSFFPSSATPKSPEFLIPHLALFSASWKPFPLSCHWECPSTARALTRPSTPGAAGSPGTPWPATAARTPCRGQSQWLAQNSGFLGETQEESVKLVCPTEPPSSAKAVDTLGNAEHKTKLPQASGKALCDTAQ